MYCKTDRPEGTMIQNEGRRGRERMLVGFTTTYAISAYHH